MEELNHKGTTTGFLDKMILFDDLNRLAGLEKVREIEAYYHKDLLNQQGRNH
ncbi:MAG: hypothetical protein ABSB22_00125 [Thermodesulfobacteriota bacterium]|jgi:hypothetical protein